MFVELNQTLRDGSSSDSLSERTVTIEDQAPTNASFLFYHFASLFLKNSKGNVLFIACDQTEAHYTSVASRLGLMLQARQGQPKRFACLELHSLFSDAVWNSEATALNDCLLKEVDRLCHSFDSEGPLLIIWDNAEILLDLGASLDATRQTLLSLQKAVYSTAGTLVLGVHSSPRDSALSAFLTHWTDYLLITRAIGTGFSKDVTGEVEIQVRRGRTLPTHHLLHYRLGDRSVKFIAPGLAAPIM
uniref:Elongator complex protein 6 n=1 Tax=Plectus sambesii TaxID=2011161 RepID=A0A914V1Y6_9BILA